MILCTAAFLAVVVVCSMDSTAQWKNAREPGGAVPSLARVMQPESMEETETDSSGDSQREETQPLPEPSSFATQADMTASTAVSSVSRGLHAAEARQAKVARIKHELFSYLRAAQKQYASAKRRMSELKKESVALQKERKTVNSERSAQTKQGTEDATIVGEDASTKAEEKHTYDVTKDTVMQDQHKTTAGSKFSTEQLDHLSSESQQHGADPERLLRWREKKVTSEAQSTQTAMANAAADIASLETEVGNLFGLMSNAEDDSRQTSDEQDPLMEILSRMERQRAEVGRSAARDHVDITVPNFGEEFIRSRYPKQQSGSANEQHHQLENGHKNSSGNMSANMSLMNLTSYAPYKEDTMPELATSFAILSLVVGHNSTRMATLQAQERELAVELEEAERDRAETTRDLKVIKDEAEIWLSLLEASSEVEREMSSKRQAEARRVDAEVNVEKKQGVDVSAEKVGAQRLEQDKALLKTGQDTASQAILAKVASVSGNGAEKDGAGRLVAASQHKAKHMAAMALMRQSVELAKEKQSVATQLSDDLQLLNFEIHTGRSVQPASISFSDQRDRDQEKMVTHWKKATNADRFNNREEEHHVTEATSGEHESESEQCRHLRDQSQTSNGTQHGKHLPAAVGGKQLTSSEHQALLVQCALAVSKNMRAAHHQYVAVAQHIAHLESQVGDLFALVPEQTS